MFIIRPIKKDDIDALMDLLQNSGHGLTSLPKDRKIIENKILISERSFEHRGDRPNGESYLFVMEELFTGKIVGVSGLISKIGGFDPYYFYRLKVESMHSKMLDLSKEVKACIWKKSTQVLLKFVLYFSLPSFEILRMEDFCRYQDFFLSLRMKDILKIS